MAFQTLLKSNHEQDGWFQKALQIPQVFSPSPTKMTQAPRQVDGSAVLQQVLKDDNPLPDVQALDAVPAGNQQKHQAAMDAVGSFFLGFI